MGAKSFVFLFAFFITILFIGYSLYTYLYYFPYVQNKNKLLNFKDKGVILKDRNGTPFYFVNDATVDDYIPLSQVSPNVKKAVIAAEDKDFYTHFGVSPEGMIRSAILNLKNRRISFGGSTITQQLVKNALLSPNRNIHRKAQEAILALNVEANYTKDEIIEMYLNTVYFGEGAIGINNASKTYFNKKAKDLTIAESAYLAGMLKFPSTVSPYSGDKDLGMRTKDSVLIAMEKNNLITSTQKKAALHEKLVFKRGNTQFTNSAPHFAVLVMDYLKDRYGEGIIYEGLEVTTTLDSELQEFAEDTLDRNVKANRYNGVTNGAIVSLVPSTGEVIALVGSHDWFDEKSGKVNMAISPRQPGSSFKPIVYSLALENGLITPATILKDTPRSFVIDKPCYTNKDCIYKPSNYDRKFRGNVTVRRALANSLNVPAVEVMQKVGIDELLAKAPDFGITTLKDATHYGKGLSLVLGTAEVSPLDMATSYSTFAADGMRPEPQMVLEIKDKYGKVIYEFEPKRKRVISEQTAFLINSILSDNNARSEVFGSTLTTYYPSAVKTGTTENYRDAWTIGYTPSLVTAVWIGNNDASYIRNLSGSQAAGPIWKSVMNEYISKHSYTAFKKPDSIISYSYCDLTSSGSARQEFFSTGTQPKNACRPTQLKSNVAKSDQNLPQLGGESIPISTPSPTPQ